MRKGAKKSVTQIPVKKREEGEYGSSITFIRNTQREMKIFKLCDQSATSIQTFDQSPSATATFDREIDLMQETLFALRKLVNKN